MCVVLECKINCSAKNTNAIQLLSLKITTVLVGRKDELKQT